MRKTLSAKYSIREELKNAKKELEGPLYRALRKIIEKLHLFG